MAVADYVFAEKLVEFPTSFFRPYDVSHDYCSYVGEPYLEDTSIHQFLNRQLMLSDMYRSVHVTRMSVLHVCTWVCISIYLYLYIYIHVCLYLCMSICLYVCMSVCLYDGWMDGWMHGWMDG